MSFESLIKKSAAKTGEPIKLKRRNAQPEAIEQAKVIAWARLIKAMKVHVTGWVVIGLE